MDQPAVGAETFILKTNVHSLAAEIELEKLLEDIPGVHRISIDPTEIGKITILGTIDPKRLIKILWNKGIKSEQVLGPRINLRDSLNVTIDDQVVDRLEKLSKLQNFETVDLTKDGIKLKYKKDGKTGSCSTIMDENAAHKNGEHGMNNYCDFHGNYKSHCPRNQGKQVEYCHGCRTNSIYMPPHEGISIGIPLPTAPDYTPSAPPMPVENDPIGFFVFFFMFLFVLVIQAALA
ncbi:hypothetical protein ACET3Z_014246 [Daucus carota]